MANGNKDDVLFARGAAQSDDSDMWDDTALIKAYDKAVASFKTALKGENDPPALKKDPPGKKRKNNKNNVGRKRSNAPPDKEMIPPPPPMSPDMEDDEALGAMLISWYMSGYHTGYYLVKTVSFFAIVLSCYMLIMAVANDSLGPTLYTDTSQTFS
ncbi:hypothetical protein NHX12_028181 [Muraenolepis orangiensis]|uniref:Survival Motor Neuron Gemin2-binding domain-containing protein n=1 Tax=Muraenolepis orangiensis TaxID=630683 RepID=A0A9Q0EA40_9TELE|nr:hypothetical protein NHX12_028181 [Muraenolepis orangiensis]